jgi:predicted cupin superfamily sugar epimerase
MLTARRIIAELKLRPHPEGGWYRETWRDLPAGDARGCGSLIYFLLDQGEVSRWHRIDATEIWHFYAGAPLLVTLAQATGPRAEHMLGPDITVGQAPQLVIPPRMWQNAEALSGWTLVGCTVTPAFEFEHFELAPDGWEPGRR